MLNILDIKLKRKTAFQTKELIEFRVNISYKISNEYFLFKSLKIYSHLKVEKF